MNKPRLTAERIGVRDHLKPDLYYTLLTLSWTKLWCVLGFTYFFVISVFALVFYSFQIPIQDQGSSLVDYFAFSVQTLSTIGYGSLSPQTWPGHFLVTIEAFVGFIIVAAVTGLIFTRISKPQAQIIFSKNFVISKFNGKPCLSLRVGNMRGNEIVDAKVRVTILFDEWTQEGEHVRRMHDLKLKRSETPFFQLTWSIFHEIDESSPLFNKDMSSFRVMAVTVSGHDGTLSSTVYSRQQYFPEDMKKDRYFQDIFYDLPDGKLKVNYQDFHKLKK